MTPDQLQDYLGSWLLHLRAERKSPNTVKNYGDGVRSFLRWAQRSGVDPDLTRPSVNMFIADLIEDGGEGETVASRQAAVRRLSAWLVEEGELDTDELLGLKRPKIDVKVIEELTEDQLKALLATCKSKAFIDVRDDAVIRFMTETMARIGEVVAMDKDEVDLPTGTSIVRRGKGGKGRRVPFTAQTARALDRYMRRRKAHPLADRPQLWLGDRGRGIGYDGLYTALKRRAVAADPPLPEEFTPHWLRHTGAGRWLGAGGSEGGLMAVGGWARREMIDRYTRATSEKRAAEEARRLNLGDL